MSIQLLSTVTVNSNCEQCRNVPFLGSCRFVAPLWRTQLFLQGPHSSKRFRKWPFNPGLTPENTLGTQEYRVCLCSQFGFLICKWAFLSWIGFRDVCFSSVPKECILFCSDLNENGSYIWNDWFPLGALIGLGGVASLEGVCHWSVSQEHGRSTDVPSMYFVLFSHGNALSTTAQQKPRTGITECAQVSSDFHACTRWYMCIATGQHDLITLENSYSQCLDQDAELPITTKVLL